MTIDYFEREITLDSEKVPFTERLKLLSELPTESVCFVDSTVLLADIAGNVRIIMTSNVLEPEDKSDYYQAVRVIKITRQHFIVDRSHSYEERQALGDGRIHRIEDFGETDTSDSAGFVIGLIETPNELLEAIPIIEEQFGITLTPLELDFLNED